MLLQSLSEAIARLENAIMNPDYKQFKSDNDFIMRTRNFSKEQEINEDLKAVFNLCRDAYIDNEKRWDEFDYYEKKMTVRECLNVD